MQDRSPRVHRRSTFNYNDSVYLDAAEEAKFRSLGHCQKCGRLLQLEAHHWSKTYPPADLTTPDDLTAFCRDCHDEAHDFRFFLDAGGSPRRLPRGPLGARRHPPTAPRRWPAGGPGPVVQEELGRACHRQVEAPRRRGDLALFALEARVAARRRDRGRRRTARTLARAHAVPRDADRCLTGWGEGAPPPNHDAPHRMGGARERTREHERHGRDRQAGTDGRKDSGGRSGRGGCAPASAPPPLRRRPRPSTAMPPTHVPRTHSRESTKSTKIKSGLTMGLMKPPRIPRRPPTTEPTRPWYDR